MVKKSKKTSIKKQNTGSSPFSLSPAKKSSKTKRNADAADDVVIDERITWEDIAAMSDSDDGEDDGAEMEVVLNGKAKSLRQAINDGKLSEVLASLSKAKSNGADDEEEFEEDVLESSSEEEDEEAAIEEELVVNGSVDQQENDTEDDEGNEDTEDDDDSDGNVEEDDNGAAEENMEAAVVLKSGKQYISVELGDDEDDDGDEEDEEGDEEGGEGDEKDEGEVNSEEEVDEKIQKYNQLETNNHTNSKALSVVTAELAATHSKLHWAEKFVIVPPSPLPFGGNGNAESNPLDIHDDLKREVAFYNTALEAVNIARLKCKEAGVPFARPEDFFAEMVKTDDHMAKVKDRLIFETKKIEAVSQRKSNKEQKLRAKESQSNRLAEKSKRKRDHFQQVEEWANSAARQRGGALRDDIDEKFLNGRNDRISGNGLNKKRQAADRKFGYGGKKGRFKQNDRQSMNDMSGFNPRGNFAEGMKRTASKTKGGSGSGASRTGKRARDAKRARR